MRFRCLILCGELRGGQRGFGRKISPFLRTDMERRENPRLAGGGGSLELTPLRAKTGNFSGKYGDS